MKAERGYPRYTVTPKAEAAILRGHPWVYGEEILDIQGETENGGLVDVLSRKGRYLGTGFLSQQSKIRVRLLSRNANDRFDEAFWERKLRWAWDYRKSVLRPEDLSCCRVIFGEADAFPGLTVDRFGPILVAQVLSVGMEVRRTSSSRPSSASSARTARPSPASMSATTRPSGTRRACPRARAGIPCPARSPRPLR